MTTPKIVESKEVLHRAGADISQRIWLLQLIEHNNVLTVIEHWVDSRNNVVKLTSRGARGDDNWKYLSRVQPNVGFDDSWTEQ